MPGFLANPELDFLLFGGKGGVGKTTAAAASSLYLADQRPERKVLVISTDPAHSLSDSFDQPIGDRITRIKGVANLFALEMDAPRRMAEFKAKHWDELETTAWRGTILDRDDISEFLSLSLPGLDEMMAVIEIADIIASREYGLVILDTAPTGHTIKLLELPDLMLQWLGVLKLMQSKYRYIVFKLTGRRPHDKVDDFLRQQLANVRRVKALFTNRKSTRFVPVTIPEEMAIEETQRLLDALYRLNVPVETIVVNRVAADSQCPFCRTRHESQRGCLQEIEQRFSPYSLVKVPLLPQELQGKERLQDYVRAMLGQELPQALPIEPMPAMPLAHSHWRDLDRTELILFGGKGGVGKTTSAVATALHLNAISAGKRTLIFSTDPAHSLSDSLQQEIGDKVTPVMGVDGLFALELDPARLLAELKQQYREAIAEAFDSFLGEGVDLPYDRAIMEELINATPPGIDELMGLMKIMDFMEADEFDRYILDMAPTGHALRFLELPDIIREWLNTGLRLVLKYREVARAQIDKTAEVLLRWSRQLRLVEGLLCDPQRCQFVCVTIPEAMPLAETRRLVQRLAGLRVACREVIVNMVVPATDCRFCWTKRWQQQSRLRELGSFDLELTEVPLFPKQIVGLEALGEAASAIYTSRRREESVPSQPKWPSLLAWLPAWKPAHRYEEV
ncbi:MAG: ArsA family ATPase [Anaerolineae bacterium]